MKKVDRTLVELQEIASKTVKNNNNNNNNNKNYNNNDSNNNNSHIQSSISKNSNSNLKMEESKVKTLNVCLLGMKASFWGLFGVLGFLNFKIWCFNCKRSNSKS